jgi:hypothetical protein
MGTARHVSRENIVQVLPVRGIRAGSPRAGPSNRAANP